jgi:hypothetical protein
MSHFVTNVTRPIVCFRWTILDHVTLFFAIVTGDLIPTGIAVLGEMPNIYAIR